MDNLLINATESTPAVDFNTNGNLTLEGRSFSEDPQRFFDPLIEFCTKLNAFKVNMVVKMDYMNTSSSKYFYNLLATIESNPNINDAHLQWYYEEDDEELLEAGEMFSDECEKIHFEYLPFAVEM